MEQDISPKSKAKLLNCVLRGSHPFVFQACKKSIQCRPATKQNLGVHAAKICVPNIVDAVELGSDNATSTYFFAAVLRAGARPAAPAQTGTVSHCIPVAFPCPCPQSHPNLSNPEQPANAKDRWKIGADCRSKAEMEILSPLA